MAKQQLQRTLGFWDVLLFGIGGMIGAGIYAIIGKAAALGGNMLWLSFVLASVVALLTGSSYAEFVSRFPDAGGSFEYIKQGFNERIALVMSVFMAVTGTVAAAAIAIGFAEYATHLVHWPSWVIVLAILAAMACFNIIGARYSSYYNMVATVITLLGLGLVIVLCLPDVGQVDLWQPNEQGWTGILAGAALIFFSYVGFEDLVKLAEETKNPRVNLPRAVLLSGVIVLLLYVLIAVCSVSVLGAEELGRSSGPLAAVIETKWALGGTILSIVALFATSNSILSNILATSRLLYDVARDSEIRWLKHFTTLSGSGNAPTYAILAIAGVAMIFGLIGDLQVVASISNGFIFVVFAMVNAALLKYRWQHPDVEGTAPPFKVPLNINNISILTVLALLSTLLLLGYNVYNMIRPFL